MVKKIKTNKKRRYNPNIKVHGLKKVTPPENQGFKSGFSVDFMECTIDPKTGHRNVPVRRVTGRFETAEDMATFFEQRANSRHVMDMYPREPVEETTDQTE